MAHYPPWGAARNAPVLAWMSPLHPRVPGRAKRLAAAGAVRRIQRQDPIRYTGSARAPAREPDRLSVGECSDRGRSLEDEAGCGNPGNLFDALGDTPEDDDPPDSSA
jgi:hypothetical protein